MMTHYLSQAAQDVIAERERQQSVEGWTLQRDDNFTHGEIAGAAACYLMHGLKIRNEDLRARVGHMVRDMFPWAAHWWKPKDHRIDLVRAGALILAEIERLDRLPQP